MIHYHGAEITPDEIATEVLAGRHGFVSFAAPNTVRVAAEVCQSFAFDNGAFSIWKRQLQPNWPKYYEWVKTWKDHPGFDWAIIPDVIDGTPQENDDMINAWPFPGLGVPVWHMNESFERLKRLTRMFRRVALGSAGEFASVGTEKWWERMAGAMDSIVDLFGRAPTKLHGLRMLDPKIYQNIPLASADSTNVGRNTSLDTRWIGPYEPPNKKVRGIVLAERAEVSQSCSVWRGRPQQESMFNEMA